MLQHRGVSVDGLLTLPDVRSFHWRGRYGPDLDHAETIEREPNAAAHRLPRLEEPPGENGVLFLANDEPAFQLQVADQAAPGALIAIDTRENWIREVPDDLRAALGRAHVVFLNEAEAGLFAPAAGSLQEAAAEILALGPATVVIKRGAAGASAISPAGSISIPPFEVATSDPTGAGDSFAGGFLGSIGPAHPPFEREALRDAMCAGAATASLTVEEFGTEGIAAATPAEVRLRASAVRENAVMADG
jgi:sugar/nucleoside kinase (ribokinase family)